VLAEVRQAGELGRVEHVADVAVDGGGGAVRGRVADEQALHVVVEEEAAVLARVLVGLEDVVEGAEELHGGPAGGEGGSGGQAAEGLGCERFSEGVQAPGDAQRSVYQHKWWVSGFGLFYQI